MQIVSILRQLWRHRLLVAVGLALALLVGTLMAYRVSFGLPPAFETRQYKVGIASAEVLVDSPNSQVIDLGGSETRADVASLSSRARLLGDLVATSPLKDQIARRAGIAPDLLIAIRPSVAPFVEPTPLETGAAVSTSDPSANILSVRVHESLPIIGADAQAPDPALAARISDATVTELGLYLGKAATAESVPDARKLVLEALGPARSSVATRGPKRSFALFGGLVVLVVWCAGILLATALARSWKQLPEQAGDDLDATGPAPPAELTSVPARAVPPLPEPPELTGRRMRVGVREGEVLPDPERPRRGIAG